MDERHILQELSNSPTTLLLGYIVIELLKAQLFSKRRKQDEDKEEDFKCRLNYEIRSEFIGRLKSLERKIEEIDKKLT